jgi:hypothetical protein
MTRAADVPVVQAEPSKGHVAPLLPTTSPAPEPARRISFLKAVVLFWLLPRRYGPHLAVGLLRRALAAHGVSVLLAAVLIGDRVLAEEYEMALDLHRIRIAAAEGVVALAARSAWLGWNWRLAAIDVGIAAAIAVGTELALVLLAIVVMPWCAGGDRAGSVFKRSLKNVYWSTTILIPASAIGGPLFIYNSYLETSTKGTAWIYRDDDAFAVLLALIVLFVVLLPIGLLFRMLLVGAGRYVGPADGPAFAPREPRCDACGYLIIGLPLETNCPECGLPVRESLPGGRRRPTEWQQHEFRPRGFVELLRMQWQILRRPDFFQGLPVHEGWSAARHFWWSTFLLVELVSLGALLLLSAFPARRVDLIGLRHVSVVVAAPLLLQAAMMFAGCLWAQIHCGIRDYRVSAIACYYAAPLIWPLAAMLLVILVFGEMLVSTVLRTYIPLSGLRLDGELTVLLLMLSALLLALTFWWLRLRQALRAVRYANV